jgi:cytolysin-activating lysine-acyltransferase
MKKISNGPVLDGLFLFATSENHRWYSVAEFYQYFIYPLMYDKIRFYYDDEDPTKIVGLFTWVFLSKEKAEDFLDDRYVIQEGDYIAEDGDEIWGLEFIAPYGHAKKMVADLKKEYVDKYGKPRPIYWRRLNKPSERRRGKL